jgi:gliding motility-associated-like protein
MQVKTKVVILSLLLSQALSAQREYSHWFFGYGAGMRFDDGGAVAIADIPENSPFDAFEGCASWADPESGELLLYTDGKKLFNRRHLVTPNGDNLGGNENAAQNSLFVPLPGDPYILYLFTNDAQAGRRGLRYSVIDLRLDNGLGDVVAGRGSLPLKAPVAECLSGTMHANGRDYWVLAHDWGNNHFLAYLVTPGGLVATPVVSAAGSIRLGGRWNANAIGYHKFSPNGEMLATTFFSGQIVELFQFNRETGEVFNPIRLPSHGWDWGVSFSPDNSKLYVSTTEESPTSITQYDVSVYDREHILNSETIIGYSFFGLGALQLAVDGKIYIALSELDKLGVIHCPNAAGADCDYDRAGFDLGGRTGNWGLPNNMDFPMNEPRLQATFTYQITCSDQPVRFFSDIIAETYRWQFDDPGSGSANTSLAANPEHQFSEAGTYRVELEARRGCQTERAWVDITVTKPVIDNLSINPATCHENNGAIAVLAHGGAGELGYSLNGDDFQASPRFSGLERGEYLVRVRDEEGCQDEQTAFVPDVGGPIIEEVHVDPTECGKDNGTIVIFSSGGTGKTRYSVNGADFQNNFGFRDLPAGDYLAVVTDENDCSDSRPVRVDDSAGPVIGALETTPPDCGAENGALRVEMLDPDRSYQFSIDGQRYQDSGRFDGLPKTSLNVFVRDDQGCEIVSDLAHLTPNCAVYIPSAFSPNGDGLNDLFQIFAAPDNEARVRRYLIFDRWGELLFHAENFSIHDPGLWWDGRHRGRPVMPGVYVYLIEVAFKNGYSEQYAGEVVLVN